MNNKLIIEKTMTFVKKKLEGEGSGHDWWHVKRVYNTAVDIAHQIDDVDLLIVQLGALLHDIADHKFGYSDKDRKDIIESFLLTLDVPQQVINQVVYIANHISYKGGTNKHQLQTIESKIVQDADRLDAIGAIGIGRTFTYGGYKKRPMYAPLNENDHQPNFDSGDTLSHFYEKLLLLKDLMNTDIGRLKAQQRHDFMVTFLDQFYEEWDGKK